MYPVADPFSSISNPESPPLLAAPPLLRVMSLSLTSKLVVFTAVSVPAIVTVSLVPPRLIVVAPGPVPMLIAEALPVPMLSVPPIVAASSEPYISVAFKF